MNDTAEDIYVTVYPRTEADHQVVREAITSEGLPVDEQTQFAGAAAFETALSFAKDSIECVARLARKLLDADRIEEITIEYDNRKVTFRGLPASHAQTVEELAEHIFAQIKA